MPSKEQTYESHKSRLQRRSLRPTVGYSNIQMRQPPHPSILIQQAQLDPSSLPPHAILQLQRTLGNQTLGEFIQRKLLTGKKWKVSGPLNQESEASWEGFLEDEGIVNRFFKADEDALKEQYNETVAQSKQHKTSNSNLSGGRFKKLYDDLVRDAKRKSVSPGGEHWDELVEAAVEEIEPGFVTILKARAAADKVWPKAQLKVDFPENFANSVKSQAKPKPEAPAPKVIPPEVSAVLQHANERYTAWVQGQEPNRGAWYGSDQHGPKPADYEGVSPSLAGKLEKILPTNGWRLTGSLSSLEGLSLHKYGGPAKGQDFIYHL